MWYGAKARVLSRQPEVASVLQQGKAPREHFNGVMREEKR